MSELQDELDETGIINSIPEDRLDLLIARADRDGDSYVTFDEFINLVGGFMEEAQLLSGRVLDSRPWGCGFKPHWHHCILSLSNSISLSLVLVQPRKTRPFIIVR